MKTQPTLQSHEEWLSAHEGPRPGNIAPQPKTDVQLVPSGDGDARKDDCSIESEPLIPEGKYKVAYLEHWTVSGPGTGKLVIQFSITQGPYQGTILKAYYRVLLKGSAGKFGRFAAKRQGEYFEQMCELFPDLAAGRTDRISPQRMKGEMILAEVATVKSKWNGKERKKHTQYSKINRMISLT